MRDHDIVFNISCVNDVISVNKMILKEANENKKREPQERRDKCQKHIWYKTLTTNDTEENEQARKKHIRRR